MAATGIDAQSVNATLPNGQPMYTQRVRDDFASPQMQAALARGGSSTIKIGNTEYSIVNGKVMAMKTGGVLKPLLAAAAVAGTAGIASGAVLPGLVGGSVGSDVATEAAAGMSGGTVGGGVGLGLSQAELLRYGLPVAGNLVGNILQANAAGKASDAQQKYLEQALAYQKEQDAYTRAHQVAREGVEASRYADYEGRIAPYLATGASANDRMAQLLGLPAAPGGSGGGYGAIDLGDAPGQFTDAMRTAGLDPVAMQGHGQQIADAANRVHPELALGVDPQSDAILYHGAPIDVTVDSGKGGWSFRQSGPASSSYGARLTAPTAARTTTMPAAGAAASAPAPALVTVQAPTGERRQVPQADLDHYLSRGATLVSGVA